MRLLRLWLELVTVLCHIHKEILHDALNSTNFSISHHNFLKPMGKKFCPILLIDFSTRDSAGQRKSQFLISYLFVNKCILIGGQGVLSSVWMTHEQLRH